jgi:hypothetical protein
MRMNEHNCRVCGLYIDDLPWGEDGICPTYELCPCCNVEFGNEDYTIESTKQYREKWINKGAKWFKPKEKPDNWNLRQQLKCIPQAFV